jgi:hypothetical protein
MNDMEYYTPMVEGIHDLVTVALIENQIKFFGPSEKINACKASKIPFDKLKFDSYFHMFDVIKDQVVLVGLRSRYTNDLVSKEETREYESNLCNNQ